MGYYNIIYIDMWNNSTTATTEITLMATIACVCYKIKLLSYIFQGLNRGGTSTKCLIKCQNIK